MESVSLRPGELLKNADEARFELYTSKRGGGAGDPYQFMIKNKPSCMAGCIESQRGKVRSKIFYDIEREILEPTS